jgi:hypothetical protein
MRDRVGGARVAVRGGDDVIVELWHALGTAAALYVSIHGLCMVAGWHPICRSAGHDIRISDDGERYTCRRCKRSGRVREM